MTRTDEKWPTRDRDEKPLEVSPPPALHTCEVVEPGRSGFLFFGPSERSYRPVGTCWRCPECWRWWVALPYGSRSIQWHRVTPLTPTWWRCRRAAKELR